MISKVWQIRIPIWISWRYVWSTDIVGVIACDRALHLVEIRCWECIGLGRGVDGCLVDAAELVVSCDTLGDIEGVQGDVAGGVVWEELAVDDGLGVGC